MKTHRCDSHIKKGDRAPKLAAPSRPADRCEEFTLLGQNVRLAAWHGLHFYKLPTLVGLVLCVEFLKADGTLRFQRPLWLFWTGALDVPLADLCRMYLWRFAIEHMFRFLKQHLGLTTCCSPDLDAHHQWVWACALAYTQLLLIRHAVINQRPPWQPAKIPGQPLTARQVQRNALPFLLALESRPPKPKPTGKAPGAKLGVPRTPRPRFPVIKKGKSSKIHPKPA
jgi:hypothetical protein